jgi:hypothetical protein
LHDRQKFLFQFDRRIGFLYEPGENAEALELLCMLDLPFKTDFLLLASFPFRYIAAGLNNPYDLAGIGFVDTGNLLHRPVRQLDAFIDVENGDIKEVSTIKNGEHARGGMQGMNFHDAAMSFLRPAPS